tara:strand:+ start:488 stop:1078 length:591 start_codon:yes stop_codon:yes gene_type:complete
MVRYKPSQFTKRELEIMVSALALDKGLDFLTGGKLNQYGRKAAVKIVKTTLPLALRVAGSVVGSSAQAAVPLVTNPYLAGTALGLGALASPPGQQLLDMAEDRGRMDRIRFEQALTDLTVGVGKTKARTKSKFNKAVSAGMKAVKASTSYGKKGTITNAKKAFTAVTKTASAIKKGGKVAKTGIKRKIGLAIKRVL